MFNLGGALPEVAAASLGSAPALTLPALLDTLKKAAVDPRISGVFIKFTGTACGWGKLAEVRRALLDFRKSSGKYLVGAFPGAQLVALSALARPDTPALGYMTIATERSLYLAAACEEVYMPPSSYVSLTGLSVSGTFLRGVFDKVGIEPQIKRIGKFKSAGDQLQRADMSDAQREVLTSLLEQTYAEWSTGLAEARGKSVADVAALLSSAEPPSAELLAAGGWITGTMYADEMREHLKARTGGPASELRSVNLDRYKFTSTAKLGINRGAPVIALLRTAGGISSGAAGGSGGGITDGEVIAALKRIKKDKRIKALLLRIDSPGGDALASDLIWRELRKLGKPVIASQSDVAASGGYYVSMACDTIVAEALTLTGSIGVITGKFNLAELFKKVGYTKEILSQGRYAELDTDTRGFTAEEEAYFDARAAASYASFRDKAALSRGTTPAAMEELAQGRVWTGQQALERGLVDATGGYATALALAKKAAGVADDKPVATVDFTPRKGGLGALFRGAGATMTAALALGGALAGARASVSAMGAPQAAMDAVQIGGFSAGGALAGAPTELAAALGALLGGAAEDAGCDTGADPLAE